MAIPTFTAVAPTKGPTGGGNIVTVTGTNFRLPLPQPLVGPSEPRNPSVAVEFDSEPAPNVDVISSTKLQVTAPPFRTAPTDDPLAAVKLTIRNLDDAGLPIAGEFVTTLTTVYTYKRPIVHETTDAPTARVSPFTMVSGALIAALRQHVFLNVVHTTHIDFSDPDTGVIAVSKIPVLIIQGPTVTRDLEYWHNETKEIDNGDGTFNRIMPPFVARLSYTLIGATNSEIEMINMIGSTIEFFERGRFLHVPFNIDDPSQGHADLVLHLVTPPQITSVASDHNIRTFTASCEVRGVEVSVEEPFAVAPLAPEGEVQYTQIDGDSGETVQT